MLRSDLEYNTSVSISPYASKRTTVTSYNRRRRAYCCSSGYHQEIIQPPWHGIGAALRTKNGKIYPAVHIDANCERIAVCAEAIALGIAISEGEKEFDTIVAVAHLDSGDVPVVSPCGMCRELLSDYSQDIKVIIRDGDKIFKCNMLDLLPHKYQ